MKNLFKVAIMVTALFAAVQVNAQTVKKDAKKVGHKTSEVAAKGASAVVDKRYRGKSGPEGQTIYINKYSHYYYVNKLGHRVYLKESQLRDK
jgi:Mn-dependent DtxR family transcriptional regulator